jgi:hypothetical protein
MYYRQILVRWKGYKACEATWEPEQHLIEDGLENQIRALEKSLSGAERYLLNIRFKNVAEHQRVYRDFASFLQEIGYLEEDDHHHVLGGSELILKLSGEDVVREFTIDIRSFLEKNKVECDHAVLYKIVGNTSGICCLYPAIH